MYRETNRCADLLDQDWVLVDHVPPLLGLMLADDRRGASLPRFVS